MLVNTTGEPREGGLLYTGDYVTWVHNVYMLDAQR